MKVLPLIAGLLFASPALAQTAPVPPPTSAQRALDQLWNEFGQSADNAAVMGTDQLRMRTKLQAAFAAYMQEIRDKADATTKEQEAKLTAANQRERDLQKQLAARPVSCPQPVAGPQPRPMSAPKGR